MTEEYNNGSWRKRKKAASAVEQTERRALVLQMRKAGASFRQIAEHIGMSVSTAYQAYNLALEELRNECAQKAADIFRMEDLRLDDLWRAVFAKAQAGETDAVYACIKIMERRAKMWGLDAPDRHEWAGSLNASIDIRQKIDLSVLTDDELEHLERLSDKLFTGN